MMARKSVLGRGLDALIPSDSTGHGSGGVIMAQTSQIDPNPRQPRQDINNDDLEELSESIKNHGVIQPLIVSVDSDTNRYTLIAGERRLKAAMRAGLSSVPVIVRQATDQERLEIALIENIQRADLTPLETAEAYRQLNEEFGVSHEEIANRVGKSRVAVTNTIRLLKLPQSVLSALAGGKITEGHARALLGLSNPQAQAAALQTVLSRELTVRQTEELVRKLIGEKPSRTHLPSPDPNLNALADRLMSRLGTKVKIHQGVKGGAITISYYSSEELEAIISVILRD